MPIKYPETPSLVGATIPTKYVLHYGDGLNCAPPEASVKMGFDAKTGDATIGYYKAITKIKKMGFKVIRVDESIEVSPVAREYYQLTITHREQMEAQIKSYLASIAQAITDYELVKHDLRKYKEFMDYYAMIDEGKRLIKEGKEEEGRKLLTRGNQTLKSIFIDQVDVHTGEGVALKLITPRWPTIIADFMRLDDDDVEPKKIREKYKVSEAEAVVLATKNKLFLEWRDNLFRKAVEERFENLLRLAEARKKSIEEYKNMLKPILRRYKMIKEALETPAAGKLRHVWIFRPDAQAISFDNVRLWAFKPFAPAEKYKVSVESISTVKPCGLIPPLDVGAGFWREEIKEIKEALKRKGSLSYEEELLLKHDLVEALPAEPSIDHVVRKFIGDVEKAYGVEITPLDLFYARQMLVKDFKDAAAGKLWGWVYSPYFIFLDIDITRVHSRVPDGRELESLNLNELKGYTQTQNIIILHYLEVIAREKQLEKYIEEMLGEKGISGKTIEELKKELILSTSAPSPKKKVDVKKPRWSFLQTLILPFNKLCNYFGIDVPLFSLGPYEFTLTHRITKFYQAQVAEVFEEVKNVFKARFKVPGAKEKVRVGLE